MNSVSRAWMALVFVMLASGCQPGQVGPTVSPAHTVEPSPQPSVTRVLPSTVPRPLLTRTAPPTFVPTPTTAFPPEARIASECVDIRPEPIGVLNSSGVVVLNSKVDMGGHYKREFYFLDMTTGITKTVENGGAYGVSPDRSRVAYGTALLDDQGRVSKREIVVADAAGRAVMVLPRKDEWGSWLSWAGDQRFVFVHKVSWPDTLLVLDLSDGSQHLLVPEFPGIAPINSPTAARPNWNGWFNVMYDPTLTRAVYPRLVGPSADIKTYALWDTTTNETVATFEDIFTSPLDFDDIYPTPFWSPDGSHFVFRGVVPAVEPSEDWAFELYQVGRDGEVKQLTHLTPTVYPGEDVLSWSPDGRYILFYLDRGGYTERQTYVAMLDTQTLEITDFCLPITDRGEGYGGKPRSMPIWSPDGTAFLVVDWYEAHHRHVILVNTLQGTATRIAEDMEPVGWMEGAP